MLRLLVAFSLLLTINCSYGGDGTLPPKLIPLFSGMYDAHSVLIVPTYEYHDVVRKLIDDLQDNNFHIYMAHDRRYFESEENITWISIPMESFSRDRTMPSFVYDFENGKVAIFETQATYGLRELNKWFSRYFDLPVLSYGYKIKNKLLIDSKSNCFTMDSFIPDDVLKKEFSCQKILRISCRSLSCNLNEHLTILKDRTVVTIERDLIPLLKNWGYERVEVLLAKKGESLTDVLILGNDLFFFYSEENWYEAFRAKRIYRRAGYRVHAYRSKKPLCFGIHGVADAIPAML